MSEVQESYVDALIAELAHAIEVNDKPTIVSVRAELERIAGLDAQKETR